MSYLKNSTHYNNWIFTEDELTRIDRLRHVKAKKALRLEHAQIATAAANGMASGKPVRKPRSFAALVPASTTAVRDLYDWHDEIDLDLEKEEEREEKEGLQVTPLLEYLSREQEMLVREFYEAKVQESCTQLFRTSDKVKCCAVMLYKRFYLSNSVMEFHPKFIVPTAIYVAGKVEEQYINVDTIAEQLHVDHKHIIGHEMVLLEGVRFQLIMYHPFRAVMGFVDDFRGFRKSQGRELPLDALQKIHASSCVVLNELLLTELPLRHYPAYLSLAAVCHVAHDMESDSKSGVTPNAMDEFMKRSKFAQGKDLVAVHAQLDRVRQRYAELKDQQKLREQDPVVSEKHAKQIKRVYKKLKAFHVEEGGKDTKKDKESKKRKAGEDGGSKKDKKKNKKDKKEKK